MNTPGTVSKIFFPAHVCSSRTKSGFLVGWSVCSFTACVASVISNVKLRDLEAVLSALSTDNSSSFVYMGKVCGAPPIVLGVITTYASNDDIHDSINKEGIADKKLTANFWMTIHLQDNNMPSLSSEIIFYKQPNPTKLQYLSLDPLVLDIQQDSRNKAEQDSITIKNMRKIVNTRVRSSGEQRIQINYMDLILNQINSSFETEKAIIARCQAFAARRNRRSKSVSEAVKESAVGIGLFLKKSFFYPINYLTPMIKSTLSQPMIILLMFVRMFAEVILRILNLRFPPWLFNGTALKDLSATSQQIDLRLQQASYWPWQYMLLRIRDWTNTATTRAQYISMWLVANDIIIGVTIGSFLINNSEYVANILLKDLDHYTIENLVSMIEWLMGWPAGLKLNSELDKFLGELFLWSIDLWKGKKWNTLRNRIDSCDYDLDQLLLGTILFTLLTFLFPTVAVYYATFATSRVAVIFLKAFMETLLAFLNHFPLFAIMLRFKDPERLPGGLRFEICDPDYFSSYGIARVVRGIKSIWPRANRSIILPLKNASNINVDGLSPQSSDSTVDESDHIIRLRKSRMTTVGNEKNISSSSAYSTSHIAQTKLVSINPSTIPQSINPSTTPQSSYLFMQ
ncbi:17208_t:CDS:10, partial [Gigaspora margarita]